LIESNGQQCSPPRLLTVQSIQRTDGSTGREVAEFIEQRFSGYGIDVKSVGVKDIILPGDMKELLGKVVEAEKAAQANVIRRREETNATRSLLNTAKVMESNAVALRLRELETLERVTENVGSLSVYGGLDGVMNELVRLKQ
jgi:regulator of protease activity HflC (stomatin/prohibitin superfamily)